MKDGKGGWTSGWSTIARPWAEVLGLSGNEAMLESIQQGNASYRIRIRWRADIKTADQVQLGAGFGGLELNITSAVDPNGDREQLVILATTAAAQKAG